MRASKRKSKTNLNFHLNTKNNGQNRYLLKMMLSLTVRKAHGNITSRKIQFALIFVIPINIILPVALAIISLIVNWMHLFIFMAEYLVKLFWRRESKLISTNIKRKNGRKSSLSPSTAPHPGMDIHLHPSKGISFCLEESVNTRKSLKIDASIQISLSTILRKINGEYFKHLEILLKPEKIMLPASLGNICSFMVGSIKIRKSYFKSVGSMFNKENLDGKVCP